MKIFILIVPFFLLASCSTYSKNFDCPPSPGMPCTSVTDIEQMVVETKSGPDIFGINTSEANPNTNGCSERIWIATDCGKGYYIPLDPEVPCCKH